MQAGATHNLAVDKQPDDLLRLGGCFDDPTAHRLQHAFRVVGKAPRPREPGPDVIEILGDSLPQRAAVGLFPGADYEGTGRDLDRHSLTLIAAPAWHTLVLSESPATMRDMTGTSLILLVLGLAVGLTIGYLRAQSRSTSRLATLTAELESTRAHAARDLETLRLSADRELAIERANAIDKLEAARLTEDRAREMFAALSSDALHKNSTAFIERADELIKRVAAETEGDLQKRQQAIELLVNPLKETLTNVEKQMKDVEKERTDSYAALRTQVDQMGKTSEKLQLETGQLVAALRAPQTRGAWGEHQLRQVVDFAGMIEHCDFDEQHTVNTADGALRPDLVVRLAGGKHVVVDAKVSIIGFLDAMGVDDNTEAGAATRADHLRRHARHLR